MQVVILAAGRGTRLRPLSDVARKPMLPVAGRPLAGHVASAAVDAGADELLFVVGSDDDTVQEYFGSTYRGRPVTYAEQEQQRGRAHAIQTAAATVDGEFAVLNGDTLYESADLQRLFEAGPSVGVAHRETSGTYDLTTTDDGIVSDIEAKPAESSEALVDAAACVLSATTSEWLDAPANDGEPQDLTEILESAIDGATVTPVQLDRWVDVDRPWELLEANEWKLDALDHRVEGEVHDHAHLEGDVVVEEGATVKKGAVIEGPALIRSGAAVGPNAYVRGSTLVGTNVSVGHSVEVKNSVLLDGASVSHLSYVGDSVIGPDVNFGAGTNVANLRHDEQSVKFTVNDERVSTGRRKFGVVAGPGAKTAINTSLDPGVKLSSDATTTPGERVSRDR